MKKTNFISDGTSNKSDLSRLLFHFLKSDVRQVLKQKRKATILTVIGAVILIAGIIVLMLEYQTEGIVIACIGLCLFIIGLVSRSRAKPKREIKKIGMINLPVNKMAFQNGSILVDRSGLLDNSRFEFTNLSSENIRLVNEEYKKLGEKVEHIPLVLSNGETMPIGDGNNTLKKEELKLYQEEVEYHNINLKLEEIYDRASNFEVNIPAYKNNSVFVDELKSMQDGKPDHLFETITKKEVRDNLDTIDGIVQLFEGKKKMDIDIDVLSLQILTLINSSIAKMDYTTNLSLNQISVPGTYQFTNIVDKASYNYYCPYCNKELIDHLINGDYNHKGDKDNRIFIPENTMLESINISKNQWSCPLCNTETNEPYMRHKMEDELFTPVYDKLYEEHFKERLSIYNHINDEKRKFAEKAETQFHQVKRESRSKQDELKSKIRTIQSDMMADDVAVSYLNQLLVKYKRIAEQKSKEIQSDLAKSKKKIAEENAKSRKRIDQAVDEANKNIDASTKKYANLEREDQKKRDQVQSQIAENTRQTAENTERTAEAVEDTNRIMLGIKPKKDYRFSIPKPKPTLF